VNLKKVFMDENSITDKSFSFYAMEPRGGMTTYLKVTGPADDPEITYNTKALGGKLGESIGRQTDELKDAREREKLYKESRRDSLTKAHRAIQRQRRRNSIKEGWEKLQKK